MSCGRLSRASDAWRARFDAAHKGVNAIFVQPLSYVNFPGLDFPGLPTTQTHQTADLLPQTAPAVRASRIPACRLAMPPYRVNLPWVLAGQCVGTGSESGM